MTEEEGSRGHSEQTWLARWLSNAARVFLYGVLSIAVAIMTVRIGIEVFSGSFLIEPISVPEEFAKNGVTSDAVSARILDEIGIFESESRMGGLESTIKSIEEGGSTPEITVLGTGIPIRYVADALRDMLPFRYLKFSGALSNVERKSIALDVPLCPELANSQTESGSKVKLVLRETHDSKPLLEAEGSYDDVMKCTALMVLTRVDPYPAAIFLSRHKNQHAEALALIEKNLSTKQEKGWLSILQRVFSRNNNKARGELAEAYVLMDRGKQYYDDAKLAFENAGKNYVGELRSQAPRCKEQYKEPYWDAASDGLSVLYSYWNKFDKASEEAQGALCLNSTFGSALYHEAQAYDQWFRNSINNITASHGQAFDALERLKAAKFNYERLQNDKRGTFGIAYTQEAIMLARELKYIKPAYLTSCKQYDFGGSRPCPLLCARSPSCVSRLRRRYIEGLFETGLAMDPDFFNGWYEWGLFLSWKYDELKDKTDNAERYQTITAAADKYDRATRLVEQVPYLSSVSNYFWLQKADALVKRSELPASTPTIKNQSKNDARSAYCKYVQLTSTIPNIPVPPEGNEGKDNALAEGAIRERLRSLFGNCPDERK